MNYCLKGLVAIMVLSVGLNNGTAQDNEWIPLWENGAPEQNGDTDLDTPAYIVRLPKENNTGVAVVIYPGGGYGHLAVDHEGYQVADWLNENGIAGIIVRYRYTPYHHPVPLMDAQRAVRTVRHHAKEWNIDPNKVGILGFSAGGHLASTVATHHETVHPIENDPIDTLSSRPDFAVLIYPVISFTTEYTHKGSRRNLVGDNPSEELMKSLSNELQVTKDTPPTFLMHTYNDTGVPAENSILFYLALRKAGVPAEMHIYEPGQHGFGLAPNDPVLSTFPSHIIDWLKVRKILND
jgi:acetyl esterase/lipase